jgi:hypothetical protein
MANKMDARIDKLIDKSHFKSNKEVIAYVQERLPGATEAQIKACNKRKKRVRGTRYPKKIEKHYYYPVFSNHPGGYQVDLLQSSKKQTKEGDHAPSNFVAEVDEDDVATQANQTEREYPPFFFIAINTNTKYAYAYPMESKDKQECLRCLENLWEDTNHKLVSIVCDEEAGLDSKLVNDWATENKVSIKTILDQNHTSISVVDRFICTLRDMNTLTEKTKRTSENRKYRDFTVKRMAKLLKIYNKTKHQTTGMKPKAMGFDEEREYIIKKLYQSERRHKIRDYNLAKNVYVKYILPRDGMKKMRYKVSPECYKIAGKDGHAYIIQAKDGSTLQLTRWRLIPIGGVLEKGMKLARTVNNAKNDIIKSIINYHKRAKTYEVLWKNPNKERIITHEPLANLKRMRSAPNKLTRWEEAYWKSKGKNPPAEVLSA